MPGKHSFLNKLIVFGCTLSILPVLVLGFFSYMKSSGSIQKQVDNGNVQILKQMSGNIEQVLKTLDQSLNHLTNSPMMDDLLYRELSYYDFVTYNNLRRELIKLQSLDTKVTDVLLLNSENNWIINNQGLYNLTQFAHKDELLELMRLPHNSNWEMLENTALGSIDTESYACKYTIALVKKMPLHSSAKRGLALAYIPSCSLAEMLDPPTDAKTVMIVDHNFRILIHPDEAKVGHTLWDEGYMAQEELSRLTDKAGQFRTDTKAGHVSVTYVRSELNGWTYISFTQIANITKEARDIGWFTFYVCLLVIAFSVLFVWLGSRRMYTPIQGIVKAISARLPELSTKQKGDIQLIGEQIENLFLSNTSLKQELQRNTQQMRDFFLIKMYQGNAKPGEIEEKMKLYGYAERLQQWNRLVVLTLQIDVLEETRYSANDLDLLLFAVNNIVEEIVPPEQRLAPVVVDQTQVTLIGNSGATEEQFHEQIYAITELIQQKVRDFLDLTVSIGISLPFNSVSKASRRAFKEGLEALKHRIKHGKGAIIPYAGINSGKHTYVYPFPKHLRNELIDAIQLADEEKALELLKHCLDEVLQEDRQPHEYQLTLFRLLNDLLVAMQESGIPLAQIQPHEGSVYEELTRLYVGPEIETWFRTRIIQPMIQVFRDRRDSQYHNISEQMIDMIQKYYDTNLTLEECAAKLHYNTFYLSSVFKKETNLTFSDYLTMYRFRMAKEWLTESDMPIKEIARKLCYTNPQNFIRSFRKQEGMTPGQYRSQYGKAGNE